MFAFEADTFLLQTLAGLPYVFLDARAGWMTSCGITFTCLFHHETNRAIQTSVDMISLSSSATCNELVNIVTLEPVGSVIASRGRVTDELGSIWKRLVVV
jgi:hypothetical protein